MDGQLFLTSPRNSPAAHRGLFDALKCKTLVTTDPLPPPARSITEAVNPRVITLPSVDELLGKIHPHFAFNKTFEEARWDPLWIMYVLCADQPASKNTLQICRIELTFYRHTSGSTGLPKPLIWTQETGARHHNSTGYPPPEGVTSVDGFTRCKRVLVTVPPFHV